MIIRTFNETNEDVANEGIVPANIIFYDDPKKLNALVKFYDKHDNIDDDCKLIDIIKSFIDIKDGDFLLISK